jgi:NAD(P)-dependent dehydrogenase (short-subunit alcohol dehydrogenase family)
MSFALAARAGGDPRRRVPCRPARPTSPGRRTIVNIGGETGHRSAAGRQHDGEAGLAGMTKALALDLAAERITVNCVVPGRVEPYGLGRASAQPVHRPAVPPRTPGDTEDVAAMVRMLCGPMRATSRASDHVKWRLLAMTTLTSSTEPPPVTHILADYVATHPTGDGTRASSEP